jgi:hypothetical protein
MSPYEQINELEHAVEAAESCFEIWEFLTLRNDALDGKPLKDVLDEYRQFFLPTRHAHLVEIVMALSRLYDSGGNTISLITCNQLRKKLNPAENAQFKNRLAIARPMANKIRRLRHNLFAHRLDADIHKIYSEVKLRQSEVRRLIEIARQLVRQLCAGWRFPERGALQSSADTIRLLQRLGACGKLA